MGSMKPNTEKPRTSEDDDSNDDDEKLREQRESLSKEFIDYYKEKWKKYRITKKQMEMAYKLLMK